MGSELNQKEWGKEWGGVEFADNPEPRCPCVLLLDTSSSMRGAKISALNDGLKQFEGGLRSDTMAAKRVEVAVVTFGPVQTIQPFVTAAGFQAPFLVADEYTPMGEAIQQAVALIAERKKVYKANGIAYYRPWIFMITDGAPTDDTRAAEEAIQKGEASKSFMFFAVGVDGADMDCLSQISVRQPLTLRGLSFREMFQWLSNSLGTVSKSQPSDAPALKNPTAPGGWAIAG
jgi:uncharacterized protein YegL